MSYCRSGDESDVYVLGTLGRDEMKLECCGCSLDKPFGSWLTKIDDYDGMIAHLLRHRAHGDKVPQYAIARLERERDGTEDKFNKARVKFLKALWKWQDKGATPDEIYDEVNAVLYE